MTVIGIDASTNYTGISVMVDSKLMDYDLLDCHRIKDTDTRIYKMIHEITDYLDGISSIDKILIEESILKTNVATVKYLSYICGAVMLYASQRLIELKRVLPSQWRAKVGIKQNNNIKREKLKQEAVEMVNELFGITVSDDIAESILIAQSEFINNK